MQINNHCVFRGKKKWKPFLLPVSCSDLSKSCTWALVLHKIAALQIKATGANKGHSLIVLLRPVMSVFFLNTRTLWFHFMNDALDVLDLLILTNSWAISLLNGDMILTKSSPRHLTKSILSTLPVSWLVPLITYRTVA